MQSNLFAPVWSEQQRAIQDWFRRGRGNLVVVALAGTGKTTTIVSAIDFAPERNILLCAFNKSIADELTLRIKNKRGAKAKTLHGVGYGMVMRAWPGIKAEFSNERADMVTDAVIAPNVPDVVRNMVSKLHTKGREINPHARHIGDLTDIALNFECEPDEQWIDKGYDLEFVERAALDAMEYAASTKPPFIDGADMIFLPCRNRWLVPFYDLVIVDEAQDMTAAQLEIAQGVCKRNGRIAIVGDPNQAIYAFRGADSGSIARLKAELRATEMPLTITYRCGKAIVDVAKELVPTFEAGPNNPTGEVSSLSTAKLTTTAQPGDFILSRVNAPLVQTAMELIKAGKRVRIAGRDIGKGLRATVDKLNAVTIPSFLEKLETWRDRQLARLQAKKNSEKQVEALQDKYDILMLLSEDIETVDDIRERIDGLFTDQGLGQAGVITCSSVHRAKGLEADRVFILKATLRNWNQEELNIAYVAITRAKTSLVWVI